MPVKQGVMGERTSIQVTKQAQRGLEIDLMRPGTSGAMAPGRGSLKLLSALADCGASLGIWDVRAHKSTLGFMISFRIWKPID